MPVELASSLAAISDQNSGRTKNEKNYPEKFIHPGRELAGNVHVEVWWVDLEK